MVYTEISHASAKQQNYTNDKYNTSSCTSQCIFKEKLMVCWQRLQTIDTNAKTARIYWWNLANVFNTEQQPDE